MENKKIFCLMSYCDTKEKMEVLCDNILYLKKYNYPILLHSYLPIPEYISKLVDYLIVDKDNPVIDRSVKSLWWYWRFDNFQLNKMWDDTSWGAINQLKQISTFLADKDFDYHIFVTYDLDFSPHKFNEWLIHQNNSFAGSSIAGDYNRSSLIFFVLNKEDLTFFSQNLSLQDYLSVPDGRMAEDYFHDKIIQRGITFNPDIRFTDKIKGFFGNIPLEEVFNYLRGKIDDFKLFFDKNNIIFYQPKIDCTIKVTINDINYDIDLKNNIPYLLELEDEFDSFNIKYNDIEEVIEYPKDSTHAIIRRPENES